MFTRFVATAVAIAALPTFAFAEVSVEQKWKEFQANPKAFMMKVPPKTGPATIQRFSKSEIESGRFLEAKAKIRKQQRQLSRKAECETEGTNCGAVELKSEALHRIEDFIDPRDIPRMNGRIVTRLSEMDAMKMQDRRLTVQPWSDSYWPMDEGILGARYGEPVFAMNGLRWQGYADYITKKGNTLADIYARGDIREIANLSPSEKYDLLIGTLQEKDQTYTNGYLTPAMWRETQGFTENGKIEEWMGICQGWAAASFMLPRPNTTVIFTAADGQTKVPFFPSDIKGLASFQWANGNFRQVFFGGRCDKKSVRRDPETGRVLDEECFDLNPGNFHVALVNQVGIAGRSMVMDATFDYEVWNHPLTSYRYKYFNPQTGAQSQTFDRSVVLRNEFTNDKFRKFRSPKARAVVGVALELTYVIETDANQRRSDDPKFDALNTVQYMYDLELDENGNVIGGEWYNDAHPDFLWKPITNTRATSQGDRYLKNPGRWDTNDPLPAFWRDIAIKNAVKNGMPLYEIVERLTTTSHFGQQLKFNF
jgi:hypothetical protein